MVLPGTPPRKVAAVVLEHCWSQAGRGVAERFAGEVDDCV